MSDTSLRTHPLIVIAATTVILTCLLAIGIMTGIIPSPLARDRGIVQDNTNVPAPSARSNLNEDRATAARSTTAQRERASQRAPVGATGGTSASGAVAGGEPPRRVAAVCTNCGTITSVRAV